MAAIHFEIHGVAVPVPPEVEEQGDAAMQAWYDAQVGTKAPAPKTVKADTPKEG
jgi:hypothetical protein